MFYKFGDGTKTKTVVKKGSEEGVSEEEVYDENDNTNRRSAIIKKYVEEELDKKTNPE